MEDKGSATEKQKRLAKTLSYEKAMSMPHASQTSTDGASESWLTNARKQFYPDRVDWSTSSVNGAHIWLDSEASGCHIQDCKKSGSRKKCASCKVLVHEKCIEQLERINSCKCRPTFVEGSARSLKEPFPQHHVAHRRKQEGKCDTCGKYFQSKLSFQSARDMIAVSCSWCKKAVHNKPECSKEMYMDEKCMLGMHHRLIVPPSWIVKLPPRKYSTTQNGRQRKTNRRRSSRERRAFVIKPIDGSDEKVPLIVFVNPKSGGNQGARIMEKFQWLLNPRQVFDLMLDGGPKFGLELYRKVPNLRVLVCGGDGSVGWVLSEIDRLRMSPPPPVAILPLGTGNDLSRFLGWGSGYTDEPLSRILTQLEEGIVEKLDRWNLDVRPNTQRLEESETAEESQSKVLERGFCRKSPISTERNGRLQLHELLDLIRHVGNEARWFSIGHKTGGKLLKCCNLFVVKKNSLPLSVMNNYFSLGADADVCLEFHESREANPDKFTSRFRNLVFYGKAGGRQVLQSKFKDLYRCIDSLICDGVDLTERIRELRPVCILFLNISKYSAGTSPWGHPTGENFLPQSCNDGYVEVIGFTSTSMVATQVGGHGVRIYQCSQAILVTNKSITMQVDGEPCRLKSSRIHLKQRNQSNMIFKKKHQRLYACPEESLVVESNLNLKIYYLTFAQYEKLVRYDIEEVKTVVEPLWTLTPKLESSLDELRLQIEELRLTEESVRSKLGEQWCFLDATWTTRIYRIDEAQENLMLVGDVIEDGIYVLDLAKPEASSRDSFPIPSSVNTSGWRESPTLSERRGRGSPIRRISSPTLYELDSLKNQLPSFNESPCIVTEIHQEETEEESSISSDEDDLSSSRESSPRLPLSPNSPISQHNGMSNGVNFSCQMDSEQKKKLLLESARKGDLDRFVALHQSDARLIWCDNRGYTSLHLAAKYGHKEIVKHVIKSVPQCVLDLVDHEKGQTSLHKAAFYQRRTICRLLVNAGASLTRKDLEGNTPRFLALKANDTELAKYLENQERLQIIASDDHETAV